ncbi:hypothetical protein [Legionella oakridgensis]|uniref:hypothetical protein n=1 Tax=Legionella oakridgensis TaxID=29423 RepID=UPI0003DE58FC|nr:hypothetical protein [Legionella oakridgensis]ETO92393.1 hypothetical protein LOR_66c18530 [Legionella oakridgensis RV-2-2007]
MNIVKNIIGIITNPNVYLAAVAGVIPGALTGGVIGALSSGYISNRFGLCAECTDYLLGFHANLFIASLIGFIIGVILGGAVTAGFTIYKIHKDTIQELKTISHDNITDILFAAFSMSIKISLGMGAGALVGSLLSPGIGTALGATAGTLSLLLVLFISTNKICLPQQN